MNFLHFLAVFAFLSYANAQVQVNRSCEDPDVVPKFDVPSYTGIWYEAYRFENNDQFNSSCNIANYTLVNGVVQVLNTMVVNGLPYSIEGTVGLDPAGNGTGKLLVNFPSVGPNDSPYWVLSTDYVNYSLVYACRDRGNNTSTVQSWLLSREKTLSPKSILAINEVIEKVEALDWDNFKRTNQDDAVCKLQKSKHPLLRFFKV